MEQTFDALRVFFAKMDVPTRVAMLCILADVGSVVAHGQVVIEINNATPTRVKLEQNRLFPKERLQELKALTEH